MSSADTHIPPPSTDGSWRGHVRATLTLGLPLIAAQLAQMAIGVTDTVMVGWLGAEPLAASVLGTTLYFVAFISGNGLAQAVLPLAANAAAQDDVRTVRRSVRMGLWVVTGFAALMMPILWQAEALLLAIGQEPELAAAAQGYIRIAQWALFPAMWIMVVRSYLYALERTALVMWVTVGGVFINALLNWVFIFGNLGAPAMGLRGAAVATLGTSFVTALILLFYCALAPVLQKYRLFVRFHRPDWDALGEVIRLGLPISATLLAEVGLFAASSVMMGWLGAIPLAAHGIALQVISVVFMIPLGLSQAGTVRVGRALGRRDPKGLHRAAATALVISVSFAAVAAVVLWLVPEPLIALFLDGDDPAAPDVFIAGASLLAVAAVFQIVDTMQVVSVGLLRGIKDTRVPMLIAIASYWGLGVPAAYVLGFVVGLEGPGVWGGLAIGLFFAATLLTWRFFSRDGLGQTAA